MKLAQEFVGLGSIQGWFMVYLGLVWGLFSVGLDVTD